MTPEQGRAPPRNAHGDLTSQAPHERLPELPVARMPPQLEKNHVVPTAWQDEALARRSGCSLPVQMGRLAGRQALHKRTAFHLGCKDFSGFEDFTTFLLSLCKGGRHSAISIPVSSRSQRCNPLQCSCLENPRDGGAWWATIYGVTQSWTRLKRLSSSSRRLS